MELLERQPQLELLAASLRQVAGDGGKALLIGGEAGVGKSALVEQSTAAAGAELRILWGHCDALRTPRVLGPVYEIASSLPAVQGLRGDASREQLFARLFEALSRPPASIVVLEDVHWADEATLDFVIYLGRRIQHTRCLFIATFRNDEVSVTHPLRRVLGDLTGDHVARVVLKPLSPAAVAELAVASGRDPQRVFAVTGGNPFFVREVLATAGHAVPETVRDAVLARLDRCGAGARTAAELAAVSPGRTEAWLLEALSAEPAGIEEAVERGLLQYQGEAVAFRHELARLAVASTLSHARTRELHAQVLRALESRGADLSRLVHHAERCGDVTAILEYAPRAGQQAAALGSHRESAAHYAAALRHADRLPPLRRAELFQNHAWECYVTNQVEQTVAAANTALTLWRSLGEIGAEARALLLLSRQYWKLGNKAAADRHVADAIALLEPHPPSRELGMAYSARSQLAMLEGRVEFAVDFGHRAIELARRFGDAEIESHALNNVGAALISTGDESGFATLERSLAIALEYALQEHAGRAYANLAACSVWQRDFARAERFLAEGIAYCEEQENYTNLAYLRAYLARFELERGRWSEAADGAGALLRNAEVNPVQRIPTLVALALVRVRRGDPGGEELLDEAQHIARGTGELQRIARVAVARAELAWYRDDPAAALRELAEALAMAQGHRDAWLQGELVFWQSRFAPVDSVPDDLAEPYRLMLAGDWQAAARAWQRIGMPYEQAIALSLGPERALRESLEILDRLGAGPLAARVRRRLREQGARNVRRGPHATTQQNPAGLTNREMEVLELLVEGHSNAELARRLHLSAKTIGHHVSAILAKLEVRTRTEAASAALRLRIVASPD